MLQTLITPMATDQGLMSSTSVTPTALDQGELPVSSGIFVNILRDLNVLHEGVGEGEGLSALDELLSQLPMDQHDALPQDGNALPLEEEFATLTGVPVGLPTLTPQLLGEGDEVPLPLMNHSRQSPTAPVLTPLQLEQLRVAMYSQASQGASDSVLVSDKAASMPAQQMLDMLGLKAHQVLGERTNANVMNSNMGAKEFANALGDLLKVGAGSTSTPNLGAAAAAPGQLASTQPATAAGVPQATIHTPVGQSGWDQELGNRVNWMMKQKLPMAEIKLSPAQLGPIEVKVSVNNDQVSIQMNAAHSMTRDALETAMPRLREMLAESGLTLSQSSVSAQSQHGGQGQQQAFEAADGDMQNVSSDEGEDEQQVSHITRLDSGSGVVDLFA